MSWLTWLVFGLYTALAVAAGGHALLTRNDPRAAWGWIATCWLFPIGGALLYYLFGMNRIEQRARRYVVAPNEAKPAEPPPMPAIPGVPSDELRELDRIGQAMAMRPVRAGNRVEPLFNGDQAYPAMLAAIEGARRSVVLASYLFENHGAALQFIDALDKAQQRGVEVRVLIDGLADFYYWPRPSRLLERRGVPVARFMPPRLFPPMLHVNLRNHRKLLVVDGTVAFMGGMNIGDHHVVKRWRRDGIADLQFRIEGPVVSDLADVFEDDWAAAAGGAPRPAPEAGPRQGDAACRVIAEGPDQPLDRLVMVLLGALATAHRTVRIMTPYFLPPPMLAGALQSAALRGVDVRVLLPERSDQRWVDWASRRGLAALLQDDVQVRERPLPFAHTKLFIVDDYYVQVGSANLDPRSLHLNFELMLEVYEPALAAELSRHFDECWKVSRPIEPDALEQRPLWQRLRDSLFWLFSKYF